MNVQKLQSRVMELEGRLHDVETRLAKYEEVRRTTPWFSKEVLGQVTETSKEAPLTEVARLARPDGEMRHTCFRMPADTAEWLDETQKVLESLPSFSSYYGIVDRATAIRHTLAHVVLCDLTLDARPAKGGDPVTLNLPQPLYDKLEAKVPEILKHGARSNAGVSTVIRYVLASAMANARMARESRSEGFRLWEESDA